MQQCKNFDPSTAIIPQKFLLKKQSAFSTVIDLKQGKFDISNGSNLLQLQLNYI